MIIFMTCLIIGSGILNVYSWGKGALTTVRLLSKGVQNKCFFHNLKLSLIQATLTYLDFQVVILVRFMLGGGGSIIVAASTSVISAIVSIVSLYMRREYQ